VSSVPKSAFTWLSVPNCAAFGSGNGVEQALKLLNLCGRTREVEGKMSGRPTATTITIREDLEWNVHLLIQTLPERDSMVSFRVLSTFVSKIALLGIPKMCSDKVGLGSCLDIENLLHNHRLSSLRIGDPRLVRVVSEKDVGVTVTATVTVCWSVIAMTEFLIRRSGYIQDPYVSHYLLSVTAALSTILRFRAGTLLPYVSQKISLIFRTERRIVGED
jgi:hypothetical protein